MQNQPKKQLIQVGQQIEELLTGKNTNGKLIQYVKKSEDLPEWFFSHVWHDERIEGMYNETDLTYSFCLKLFMQLEAGKRDSLPQDTVRSWFITFLERGWTKAIVYQRYMAVKSSKKYGAVSIDDWFEAEETFTREEINIHVNRRINDLIKEGQKILWEIQECPEKLLNIDYEKVRMAASEQVKFHLQNKRYEVIEQYEERVKEEYRESIRQARLEMREKTFEEKLKIIDLLIEYGYEDESIKLPEAEERLIAICNNLEYWLPVIEDARKGIRALKLTEKKPRKETKNNSLDTLKRKYENDPKYAEALKEYESEVKKNRLIIS
jgi:hypothetical protein